MPPKERKRPAGIKTSGAFYRKLACPIQVPDFGADRLNLQSFWATEAALKGVIVAYNLLALLRQIHPQHEQGQEVGTRRTHCFAIGALLGRQGRHRVLRLGLGRERRPWFEGLWSRLHEIDPWKVPKLPSEQAG